VAGSHGRYFHGCRVKVQNPNNADNFNISASPFTVRVQYDADLSQRRENLSAGVTYPINWTYVGPIQNITIQYSL